MGKKGGTKNRSISRVKKTNIKRQKLVKAGKLKPKSKPKFVEGGQFQKKNKSKSNFNEAQLAEKRKEYEIEKKAQVKISKHGRGKFFST